MLEYKEEKSFSLIMGKVIDHDFSFSLRNIIIDVGKETVIERIKASIQ